MPFSDKEKDGFWDIDKLVPKKKSKLSPFAASVRATEYTVGGESKTEASERKITLKPTEESESDGRTYYPESALIKRVTVKRRIDKYDFYDSFRKAAEVYYDLKLPRCEFTPFYSYMPQYSQLTSEQKNYYFYWRGEVRRGKFIRCDYSYLYLYVYEILNLPERIPPEEGIRILTRLWREYRGTLPKIDAYFSVWIQDYCLIYELQCPTGEITDFLFDAIESSEWREFYLSGADIAGEAGTEVLLSYLSDYDWRRGKYVGGEHAAEYRTHTLAAMGLLLERLEIASYTGKETEIIRRDAFPHSLCTHSVKSRLEIEYFPVARDERLRSIVTGGVRYTENKLRGILGVKSRLAVKDFPDEYKALIDGYFAALVNEAQRKRIEAAAPEYLKLYAAPEERLSLSGADDIERASWSTTLRLVETDEVTDEASTEKQADEPATEPPRESEPATSADSYGLSEERLVLIDRLLSGEAELGIEADAAIDEINEAFSDGFGDIIIEMTEDGYSIIEDYKEEIKEWLKTLMK